MKKVNLFIIGAQKSGTSALHNYLVQHPEISEGSQKEIHFFDEDNTYDKGVDKYHAYFDNTDTHFRLDSTPSYLYYPWVAQRIFEYNPRAYLIAVLRDPVSRAFSAWNMYRQLYLNKHPIIKPMIDELVVEIKRLNLFQPDEVESGLPSFDSLTNYELYCEGIKKFSKLGIVARGFYLKQIENYFKLFNRSNILIIDASDLKDKSGIVLKSICERIGLEEFTWRELENSKLHIREHYLNYKETESYRALENIYNEPNKQLENFLETTFNWSHNTIN